MKKILQKSLSRLHSLLLLAVMFVVGGSAAWAQDWQVVTENPLNANSGFTIIDANGDGTKWGLDTYYGYIQYSWNASNAANDYCVLDGEELIAGATYRVSFDVKKHSSGRNEMIKIVYGSSPEVGQLKNVLLDTTYPTSSFVTYSGTFTAPTTGTYYFAIQAVSAANEWGLYAKNYKLEVDANTLADDGSVKSTFDFQNWNITLDGSTTKPAGSCHFDARDVFYTAEGISLTFTNIPDARGDGPISTERKGNQTHWPNECFYSNPTGNDYALYICNGEGFDLAAPSGYNITKVVVKGYNTTKFPLTSLKINGTPSTSSNNATWTGNAESVAFSTINGTSDQRVLISSIQVTLVPVAEEGEVTYTIDLVDAPTGAYVTLDGQRFEDDGTYPVEKSLGKNDLEAYEPEGYYAEVEYTRDNHTYTVTYKAYNYYDVTVTGTTDPAAGVVYNEQTYGNGSRIESKDVLTESSVSAVVVDGLSGSVSLAGNTFKVAYKKPAYVEFVLGGEVSAEKAGVTFSLSNSFMNQGDYGLDVWKSSWYFTINSSQFDIEKIELFNSYDSSMTGLGSTPSGFSSSNNTWTGNARSVEFKGLSTFTSDYYIVKARVYLVGYDGNEEEKERECVMDVASTFFSTGNVEQINSNLTFVADVNTEGDHSGGAVPDGVTLVDDNATNYTISSMLWWDNDSQVVFNLPSAITAPGHYTLTIPEGVIPCVGNKANKEIVFEWTIAAPTTYTVTFSDGAPAGASVTIGGNTYTESTTFQSRNNLDENSANVKEVEGYEGSVAYDSENKEFTITYTALPTYDYYVAIYPTEDTDLKIRIDGKEYGDSGMDSYTFYKELTEGDIVLPEYPGYYPNPSIEINNTLYIITVEYTPLPSLAIGSSATDREGNYWTSFCLNEPVEFGAGVTPCIVTGTDNGVLTVEEIVAEDNEYSYDLDFTTGAYSGNSFTAMDGKLTVEGVNWIFNTVYGYAETANTEDWTTVTFTLADDFNGEIKSIRLLTANDTNSAWFSIDGGITWLNNVTDITVHGKTITLGAWYDQAIKHFYLDIVESGDAPVFPANTAVLLKSDAPGAVTYYTRPAGNVDTSANILRASGETGFNVSNDADHLYYKLTLNAESEAGSAGFYWGVEDGHSITVPAHKAYLVLDAAAGSNRAAFLFGGDDTLTAIESINTEADNAPVYNLQGQRVNVAKAGVYVKNGRKIIVK